MTFSRFEKLLLFSLVTIQFNHIIDFMIVMPLGPTLMRTFEISQPNQPLTWQEGSQSYLAKALTFKGLFFRCQNEPFRWPEVLR
jgi:hypothetical protein